LVFPPCDIDYTNYITNQNVCSLEFPLECGIWTKILSDYKSLEGAIENIINLYGAQCGDLEPTVDEDSKFTDIDDIKTYNRLSKQEDDQIYRLKYGNTEVILREEISNLENEIVLKNSDIIVIEKALTNVNNPLDCTVYDNKLTELRNFNYRTYCNSIVYGSPTVNNGTKQSEYNSCISSKTLENQNEQLLYSELSSDCKRKNTLEQQIKEAKFDNNQTLVTQLEKELDEVNKNINTLTTDVNNSISFDESKQNSQLEENDTQNTINRTAELLGVQTVKKLH
jgi:hypothetical protein